VTLLLILNLLIMNKKFSTLVASLLFASAFSAYAGIAASMFAAPTAIETRAVVEKNKALAWDESNTNVLPADAATLTAVGASILPEFTNNARLFVIANTGSAAAITPAADKFVAITAGAVAAGAYDANAADEAYWTMQADGELLNNASHTFSVKGFANFDVVPVKADNKPGYFFVLRVKKADASFGGYVTYDGTDLDVTAGTAADTELVDAALFVSVESAFAATATTGDVLNNELKGGFELAISSAKDGVKVTGADAFKGKLTAMEYDATGAAPVFKEATSAAATYFLKNKDGKYIYWDADANKDSDKPGAFKLASEADALAANANPAYKFAVHAADNGSKAVQVLVSTDKRLYINNTNNEGRLTAFDKAGTVSSASNWAVTTLSSSNKVDLTQFLTGQFVKVNYVANGEEGPANKYKVDGVLTIAENATNDDFVRAANFVVEDPATQWAVTSTDRGASIVLTNRENPAVKITISELRSTDKAGVYEVASVTATNLEQDELITITAVANTEKTDGYMVETENVLRNTTYYLAQSRQNADQDIPAYWAKNHNKSHQIGATVNKDAATKWNLAFKKKQELKKITGIRLTLY
ncbi:MAG: hypothetical protein LUD46_14905, partial [Parabacteroides sp.]|nr:hypothetical protein [Parabacteroides sp.]